MRLSLLSATVALLTVVVAGGSHAATPSLRVALPSPGDASVLVIRTGAGKAPLLRLPTAGALGSGIVVATARRRLSTGWVAVVTVGRRLSDHPTPPRTVALAWRGTGRAMAQIDVGATVRPARFCMGTGAVLETARRATWRRSSLGVGTAPRFVETALRAACSTPGLGARASLRKQLEPATAETEPPPAAAGTPPAPAVPPAQPPATFPPTPPPSAPPPAPMPLSLDLAVSHRHAAAASYVCLALATSAGARVVIRLTGPSSLTSITTIPSARATETVAIEIYETGAYVVTAAATRDGLTTQATGTLVVTAAQGAGACGPGT